MPSPVWRGRLLLDGLLLQTIGAPDKGHRPGLREPVKMLALLNSMWTARSRSSSPG